VGVAVAQTVPNIVQSSVHVEEYEPLKNARGTPLKEAKTGRKRTV
jgi:hypothetical protein